LEEYESLITHAPEESPARRALDQAAIFSELDADGIPQSYVLTCDESGANALLSVAQNHSLRAFEKLSAVIGKKQRSEIK
jgi:hypothetical protein